jgi:hypothetical protein
MVTVGITRAITNLNRGTSQYALSDKFTLSTAEGNELYPVAQVLKQLVTL